MRKFLFVVVLAFILLPSYLDAKASAKESKKKENLTENFRFFNNCSPMNLIINGIDRGGRKIGLTEQAIQYAIESRLRLARLYSPKTKKRDSFLGVQVDVFKKSFSVNVIFWKLLHDPYVTKIYGMARTWVGSTIGTHGGNPTYIVATITEIFEEFLTKFLRVNEKACNS